MNNVFIEKANETEVILKSKNVSPKAVCELCNNDKCYRGIDVVEKSIYEGKNIIDGKNIIYDLGEHYTGYFSFNISGVGAVSDSPIKLKLIFAETPSDFFKPNGKSWISYSWVQEEYMNIDVIPAQIEMPRRYACRYIMIEPIAKNRNLKVVISDVRFMAVSSAGFDYENKIDGKWKKISDMSIRTLRECMQTFYEDGPKRDRRLWLGDMRLQALVNYVSFKDESLIKKCLYLFAGLCDENGVVPANLYEKPQPMHGGERLYDYQLIFPVTLYEYLENTSDKETTEELYDTAMNQFYDFEKILSDDGTVIEQEGWWCFVDWDDDISKCSAMQAIAIYCYEYGIKLSKALGKVEDAEHLHIIREKMKESAVRNFWSEDDMLFVENKRASWVLNAFMAMSGVFEDEKMHKIMKTLESSDAILPATPYVWHYVLEAYDRLGMREELESLMLKYWGGMADKGADTFWEAYKEDDDNWSPYNDVVITSYCHAWSCTPLYFIQKMNDGIE